MSDRIAVFNEGRIEQVGPPADVYEHPQSEFIAGFVGVSNVLERDGRRYTVRPEKIDAPRERPRAAARAGTSRRGRARRAVRRARHPLPRDARSRGRAAGSGAKPRGGLERGARGEGTPDTGRVASGAGVGHRRSGGRNRMKARKTRVATRAALACSWRRSAWSRQVAAAATTAERAAELEGLGSSFEEIQELAREEGEVNIVQWPLYAQLRRVHGGDRVHGQHEGRRHLGRHDHAHADRRVRRRRRLRQRQRPAHDDRRRRTDQRRSSSRTTPTSTRAQGAGSTTASTASRYGVPARARLQPPGVPHGRGSPAPTSWSVIWEDPNALRGEDLDLRRLDLHRGRRALSQGDAARARDRQPVLPRRRAVQRGSRPAEEAGCARASNYWPGDSRSRSQSTRTATAWSARRGRTSPTAH